MTKTSLWITAGIVAAGIALGWLILAGVNPSGTASDHAHGGTGVDLGEAAAAKGPHGGRLLTEGDFALEIAIFEQGVPPEMRVYAYEKGKQVDPAEVQLQVTLERLGAPPEMIRFQRTKDFLRGEREIAEPHSFKATVAAQRKGESFLWTYEQAEGRVAMSDAAAKNAGIEIRTAGPAKIRSTIELQGEIQFNGDGVAHVVPRLAGLVARVPKNLGDEVKRGDILAVVESQALADLRSEHLAARTRLELARTTFEREKRLWEGKISAEQDYLQARQALAEAEIANRNAAQKLAALGLNPSAVASGGAEALTRYDIRTPIEGVVIEKHVVVGEAVKEDATIFVVADLSTVWAEMTIYPKDLNAVRLGQPVTVRSAELKVQAEGRVAYVGSLVGEQTRSAKARVVLSNPNRSWRPGLFVTVDLVAGEAEVPVAVAADAVQTLGDRKVVFGRFGEAFEARPVELGRTEGQLVEVVKGLAPGTRYAAANSYVLKADLGKAGASHTH